MTPKLTVHNAELKTATVEVKTLTISGKQVTLAVFRQLREELLIAKDGTLNGVPWGTVNYHPDKCGDRPQHIHVVWQFGTELRRAHVKPERWERLYSRRGHEWLDAALLDGWRVNGDEPDRRRQRPDTVLVNFDGHDALVDVDPFAQDALWPESYFAGPEGETAKEKCRNAALEVIGQRVTGSRLELQELVTAEAKAEVARRRRIDACWEGLNDLPQLFIAV